MLTTRPGQPRPPSPAGRAALLLGVLALLGLLAGCGGTEYIPPTPAGDSSASSGDRDAAAQVTLDRLTGALTAGTPGTGVGGLAAPTEASQAQVAATVRNARRLGVSGVSLRYVAEVPGALSPEERAEYGPGAWVGSVQMRYRIPTYDPGPTAIDATMVFTAAEGGARIAAIGGHDERSPLWMQGPMTIRTTPRTLVMAGGGQDAARFSALARTALRQVGDVLPSWRGALVLAVPSTEQALDTVLDADPGTYDAIAGVTTAVDSTLQRGSPVHVFINPDVFDRLGPRGAQLVISHESTHVATGAPFSPMPTWLLEGFADYVALDHAGIGVQTAGGQILRRIRTDGLPEHLPTAAELAPTAGGLGATYEEAWLASRYLAQAYGEDRLVALYRAADRGTPLARAFRSVLGVSEAAFVRGWRQDLSTLASQPGAGGADRAPAR